MCRTSRKSWKIICALYVFSYAYKNSALILLCISSGRPWSFRYMQNRIRAPWSHPKVWKTIAFSSGNIYFCFSFANSFSNGLYILSFICLTIWKNVAFSKQSCLVFWLKKQTTWITTMGIQRNVIYKNSTICELLAD